MTVNHPNSIETSSSIAPRLSGRRLPGTRVSALVSVMLLMAACGANSPQTSAQEPGQATSEGAWSEGSSPTSASMAESEEPSSAGQPMEGAPPAHGTTHEPSPHGATNAGSTGATHGGTQGQAGTGAPPGASATQPGAPGAQPGGPEMAGDPGSGAAMQQPSAEEVTDEEVEAFAACHVELTQLGQRMNARVQQGEEPEVIKQEFEAEATDVVRKSDLSEERYMEIGQLTQSNPQLRQRIEQALEQVISG